jgi:anion-transporting  ArsA/GET3 family ATPase
MGVLDSLLQRQMLVVTGKGGVGKTAVSATLGRAFAEAGRRVLVVEVDPRENLHQMLGLPPSGGAIVPAGPRLWVQNLKPGQVLDEVVREQLKLEMLVRRVLDSRVYQHLAAGAPGLKELAILGHALRLLRGLGAPGSPELDTVILDAPATGHGVALLTAPQVVTEVVESGPFGRMAGELAQFIADPRLCGIAVVTTAEEMPVEEALELCATLERRLRRSAELLVVNGLYPPMPAVPPAQTADPALDLWRRRRRLNERELARLRESWGGAAGRRPLLQVELPQLPLDRGPEMISRLTACLRSGGLAA